MRDGKKRRWWLPVDCKVRDCICGRDGECRADRIEILADGTLKCPYKSYERHMQEHPRFRGDIK